MELQINGRPISVRFKSDAVVAQRVAAHILRRIKEDDWLPLQSKDDALQSSLRPDLISALAGGSVSSPSSASSAKPQSRCAAASVAESSAQVGGEERSCRS